MKKAPALFHTDCVQAFGKVKISPRKLGADLISVTAHKIHGPKGTGALYIKKAQEYCRGFSAANRKSACAREQKHHR